MSKHIKEIMLKLVKDIEEKGLERVELVTKEAQLESEIKLVKAETLGVVTNEVNDGKDVYPTVAKKEAEANRRLGEMKSFQKMSSDLAETHHKRLITEVELMAVQNQFRAHRAYLMGFTAGSDGGSDD